jgi:RNA recognition motif-containing protein
LAAICPWLRGARIEITEHVPNGSTRYIKHIVVARLLLSHFEPHRPIVEAVVITDRSTGASRNFGFVTLADRKSAAAVIKMLDDSELDGHRIVVSVATEKR